MTPFLHKQFVLKESLEEINKIFARKNLPAVMGSKSFVDKIKEMFFSNKRHEEVPESRSLAPDLDKIMEEVCKFYNVNKNDLLVSRRGYFNEVGEAFRINKNSTVGSVVERVKREMRKNKHTQKNVQNLMDILIKS